MRPAVGRCRMQASMVLYRADQFRQGHQALALQRQVRACRDQRLCLRRSPPTPVLSVTCVRHCSASLQSFASCTESRAACPRRPGSRTSPKRPTQQRPSLPPRPHRAKPLLLQLVFPSKPSTPSPTRTPAAVSDRRADGLDARVSPHHCLPPSVLPCNRCELDVLRHLQHNASLKLPRRSSTRAILSPPAAQPLSRDTYAQRALAHHRSGACAHVTTSVAALFPTPASHKSHARPHHHNLCRRRSLAALSRFPTLPPISHQPPVSQWLPIALTIWTSGPARKSRIGRVPTISLVTCRRRAPAKSRPPFRRSMRLPCNRACWRKDSRNRKMAAALADCRLSPSRTNLANSGSRVTSALALRSAIDLIDGRRRRITRRKARRKSLLSTGPCRSTRLFRTTSAVPSRNTTPSSRRWARKIIPRLLLTSPRTTSTSPALHRRSQLILRLRLV